MTREVTKYLNQLNDLKQKKSSFMNFRRLIIDLHNKLLAQYSKQNLYLQIHKTKSITPRIIFN